MPRAVVIDKDRGWRAFIRNMRDTARDADNHVVVGVLAQEGEEQVIIAASNEFGTRDGHVPERSYLRSTVDENQQSIVRDLETIVSRSLDGKSYVHGLRVLGERVVGLVKRKIVDLDDPPNAPSTIAAKGSDNPLVDTGRLLGSINYEVRK